MSRRKTSDTPKGGGGGAPKKMTVMQEKKEQTGIFDVGANLGEFCPKQNQTRLFEECEGGNNIDKIQSCIDRKADINAMNSSAQTPFYLACVKGHTTIARYLIERGADVNKHDPEESVQFLVDLGVDINAEDKLGRTPVSIAFFEHNNDALRFLISRGANITQLLADRPIQMRSLLVEWSTDVLLALLLLRKAAQENPLSGIPRDLVVYSIRDALVMIPKKK